MTDHRLRREDGIALPAVIFMVALLTLLLTSGLSRVQADRQIAEAAEATADAFAIAQSGLQNYMGTRTARPTDGDSVRVNMTGGYANVISRLVRNPVDTTENTLYLVRSTGIVITPSLGPGVQAQSTVAQFADWQTGSIETIAAFTAANGLSWVNADATRFISGYDWADPFCSNLIQPPIAAGRTDVAIGTPFEVTWQGSSGLTQQGPGTGPAVAGLTEIDWERALSAQFTPDYNSFQNGNLSFPVQRIGGTGTLSLNGSYVSSGVLIVPNDLLLNGTQFYFAGIVLVGGRIDFDAESNTIVGLVVSGLNELLGNPTPASTFGEDDPREDTVILYSSCNIRRALSAFTGMAPVPNAWQDAWAIY